MLLAPIARASGSTMNTTTPSSALSATPGSKVNAVTPTVSSVAFDLSSPSTMMGLPNKPLHRTGLRPAADRHNR